MENRRQDPRIPVVLRSDLSSVQIARLQGMVLDVSVNGCRVKGDMPVQVNDSFRMQLFLPQVSWPIQIEEARVRWVKGEEFGCQFITILPEERKRLQDGVTELQRGTEEGQTLGD